MSKPTSPLVSPAQMVAVLATDPHPTLRSEFALVRQAAAQLPPRTIGFVCSTEGTKRDGHKIITAGWQLDNYKRTGAPVLWCHDTSQPAIGTAPTMRIDGKRLVTEVTFAQPEDYAFADTVYRLYAADPPIMRAGSVQWGPLEWEPNLDEQGRQIGLTYLRSELYEFSLCPVPADPDAIMRAIQQRQVTGEEVERLIRRVVPGVSPMLVRLNDAASEEDSSPPKPLSVASPSTTENAPLPAASSRVSEDPTPVPVDPPPAPRPVPIPPAPGPQPAPVALRGPLAEALAADDEANLWEAIDDVSRCHNTMLRMVYALPPGAQDNSSQVDGLLRECDDMMRPMLMAIANNQAKRTILVSQIQQREKASPVSAPAPVAPVLSIEDRIARLSAQKAGDALAARLKTLKHPVISSPPPAAVPEEHSQQQLYFDRSPTAHASIAARVALLKQH